MRSVLDFVRRMNVLAWVLGIFIAHALLYLALGNPNWLSTALLAAAVYAVVLFAAKLIAKRYQNKQGAR